MKEPHPLEVSAFRTLVAAREGLDVALSYMAATPAEDAARMRLACGGVATACDALKSAVNAYGQTQWHVSRAQKEST